jgi:hypothetical protein
MRSSKVVSKSLIDCVSICISPLCTTAITLGSIPPPSHPSLCGLEVGSVCLRDPSFLEINALMEIYFVQYTFYDVLRNIMFLSSAENLLFGTDTEGLFLFALSQQGELSRHFGVKK